MPVDLGAIQFYLGPRDVVPAGGPNPLDNLEKAIIDFIDGAESTLDIAGPGGRTRCPSRRR